MSSLGPRLSNCYIPQPLSSLKGNAASFKEQSKRATPVPKRRDDDGRGPQELRQLRLESSVLEAAQGSALVELGHTKVIGQVLGPVTASSSHLPPSLQLNMEEGVMHFEVKYAPHIAFPTATLLASTVSSMDQSNQLLSTGKINSWTIARETDLASNLSDALSASVPLRQYPKCALLVKITVLQDDGSILPACITAATLALADASVEMYDVVAASTVAVCDGLLVADPTLREVSAADAVMTLAILPNWKESTLWQQSGRLNPQRANEAMELCRNGCRTMHRFLREHLIQENEKDMAHES
jgi:ribonuclease PH